MLCVGTSLLNLQRTLLQTLKTELWSRYPRGVLEMLSLKAASVLAKEPLEKQGRRKITRKKPRGCLESCQQRPFGPWRVGAGNCSGAGQCVGTALNTAATFCGFSSTKKE